MKKKIKPEDLQLNEKAISGNSKEYPETEGVCKTAYCQHTYGCVETFSAADACCPMSNGQNCQSNDLCPVTLPLSACICFETENKCESDNLTCGVISAECVQYTNGCVETDMCAIPISDDGDCEGVPND